MNRCKRTQKTLKKDAIIGSRQGQAHWRGTAFVDRQFYRLAASGSPEQTEGQVSRACCPIRFRAIRKDHKDHKGNRVVRSSVRSSSELYRRSESTRVLSSPSKSVDGHFFCLCDLCDLSVLCESNWETGLSVSPLEPAGLTISRTVHVSEADQNRS
jgi:hypothetical protein